MGSQQVYDDFVALVIPCRRPGRYIIILHVGRTHMSDVGQDSIITWASTCRTTSDQISMTSTTSRRPSTPRTNLRPRRCFENEELRDALLHTRTNKKMEITGEEDCRNRTQLPMALSRYVCCQGPCEAWDLLVGTNPILSYRFVRGWRSFDSRRILCPFFGAFERDAVR